MSIKEKLKKLEDMYDSCFEGQPKVIPVVYEENEKYYSNSLYYIFEVDDEGFAIVSAAAVMYGSDEEQITDDHDIIQWFLDEKQYENVVNLLPYEKGEAIIDFALANGLRNCNTFCFYEDEDSKKYIRVLTN